MKAHTYRKWSLFVLSVIMTGIVQLHAQNERSLRWKNQNEYVDRYEGTYNSPAPYQDLTLISYSANVQSYQFNFGQVLSVHFYSPYQTKAYIKAEELTVRSRYWMETKEGDAKRGWNKFSNWKVDSWLRQSSVRAENLGLIAKVKAGSFYGEHYLPIILNQSAYPGRISQYHVYFRNNFNLQEGIVKIYPGRSTTGSIPDAQPLGDPIRITSQAAGSSFGVLLDQKQLGTYRGWISLHITYKKWNQAGYQTKVFALYHPGWTPLF